MILRLEQEGKLSTGDLLEKYFPDFELGNKITVFHMLTHASGLHNITDDSVYVDYFEQHQTHEEMVERIRKAGSDFEPGAGVSYSNAGYILLGYIVEQVSGLPYKKALEKLIVEPLKLKQTKFGYPGEASPEEAYSYSYSVSWLPASNTDLSIPHGAGAIISSPADLCKFIEGLFRGKLISKEQLAKMTDAPRESLGAGMFKFPFFEHVAYGHTGGIDGFVSQLGYFPDDSLAMAICFNGMRSEPNDLALGILSAYFDKPYELPDFGFKAVILTQEQLLRCEGVYSSPDFPLEISIKASKDGLKAQATGQSDFPLEAMNETDFRFEPAKIVMQFRPSADGKQMTGLKLTQMGRSYEFTKK